MRIYQGMLKNIIAYIPQGEKPQGTVANFFWLRKQKVWESLCSKGV